MQILLFGQPELEFNLGKKHIRQLRERITHNFYLNPLDTDETIDYIRYRLHAAGCPCPQVFTNAAEKLIARASGGITRRINILADKAMLAAYAESATASRQRSIDTMLRPSVTSRHVHAAIKDSGYRLPLFTWLKAFAASAFATALLCSGIALTQPHTSPGPTLASEGVIPATNGMKYNACQGVSAAIMDQTILNQGLLDEARA